MMLGANNSVRGDRFQQALFAHEVQIGLHREARARQQGTARFDQLAWQAQRVGEVQPTRDAAVAGAVAIVVENALAPDAAQCGVFHPRQDRRIFQRNAALVFKTVQCPGLHLAAIELAVVQQCMERMLVVIQARADRAQIRLQLVGREQGSHREISRPSCATSQPAARTVACSGE